MRKTKYEKIIDLVKKRHPNMSEESIGFKVSEISSSLSQLIDLCGGESQSAGMKETPLRVIKAWLEMTEGYTIDTEEILSTMFDVSGEGVVTVDNIPVVSVCEHHVMPFFGTASITYVPKDKVLGISKLARLVNAHASKFQLQEQLTEDIAQDMYESLDVRFVSVSIKAEHTCMTARGVRAAGTSTITNATKGDNYETPQHTQKEDAIYE